MTYMMNPEEDTIMFARKLKKGMLAMPEPVGSSEEKFGEVQGVRISNGMAGVILRYPDGTMETKIIGVFCGWIVKQPPTAFQKGAKVLVPGVVVTGGPFYDGTVTVQFDAKCGYGKSYARIQWRDLRKENCDG